MCASRQQGTKNNALHDITFYQEVADMQSRPYLAMMQIQNYFELHYRSMHHLVNG